MSISPPPFSPPRADSEDDDYVRDEQDYQVDSARSLVSAFELYQTAIDRLRTSILSKVREDQQTVLDEFKPLSTRANAWLYMRLHDDLFSILIDYLRIEYLPIQSATLSILANIACEQASHEQV
jgi:hypothetical protein